MEDLAVAETDNNNNEDNEEVEEEEIRYFDEIVAVEELLLRSLVKRSDLISKQRQGMETKISSYTKEIEELELTERSLDQAMIQHLALQQELELKIRRTEEKLSKQQPSLFPTAYANATTGKDGGDCGGSEKESEMGHSKSNATLAAKENTDDDGNQKSTSQNFTTIRNLLGERTAADDKVVVLDDTMDAEFKEQLNNPESSLRVLLDKLVSPETSTAKEGQERQSTTTDKSKKRKKQREANKNLSSVVLKNPFLTGSNDTSTFSSSFLEASSHQSSFLTFHPFLKGGPQLIRIMNLMIQDHLKIELDQQIQKENSIDNVVFEGEKHLHHRREAIYQSCILPFVTKCELEQQRRSNEKNPCTTRKKNTDNNCSVEGGAEDLDPNNFICPYELAGVCADPYCTFQHLKERVVESKELIKETLPLPALKLPPPVPDVIADEEEGEEEQLKIPSLKRPRLKNSDGSANVDSKNLTLQVSSEINDSTTLLLDQSAADGGNDEATTLKTNNASEETRNHDDDMILISSSPHRQKMNFEDDFVSLSFNAQSKDDEINDDNKISNSLCYNMWWRKEEGKEKIRLHHDDYLSFIGLLENIYNFHIIDDKDNIIMKYEVPATKGVESSPSSLLWIGNLINAIQLSIHSGRLDVVMALISMLKKEEENATKEGKNLEGQSAFFTVSEELHLFFSSISTFLLKANDHSKLFCFAYLELHLILSCLSNFVQYYYYRSVDGEEEEEDMDIIWKEFLDIILYSIMDTKTKVKMNREQKPTTLNLLIKWIQQSKDKEEETLANNLICLLEICDTIILWRDDTSPNKIEGENAKIPIDTAKLFELQTVMKKQQEEKISLQQRHDKSSIEEEKYSFFITEVLPTIIQTLDDNLITRKVAIALEATLEVVCSTWITSYDDDHHHDHQQTIIIISTLLISLRVSLFVALKRYDKAQHILEFYLNYYFHTSSTTTTTKNFFLSLFYLSDILWSQLIVLRSNLRTLPVSSTEPGPQEIADTISSYKIRLNFVSLAGDKLIWKPFLNPKWNELRSSIAKFTCKATITPPPPTDKNSSSSSKNIPLMEMSLESMPFVPYVARRGKSRSKDRVLKTNPSNRLAFPRILMHGGFLLRSLDLCNCGIRNLPFIFGHHFPNLEELVANNNSLTELPSSIGNLASLVKLEIRCNQLKSLPEEIQGCKDQLKFLFLSRNQLTSLPGVKHCIHLCHLDLSHNLFTTAPNHLVLQIDTLSIINMKGNPCCKQ